MIEDRTEVLSIKNMAGDVVLPRPGFDKSPLAEGALPVAGGLAQGHPGDSGSIHSEPTQTRSRRTSTSGGGVAGTSEHVFSTKLLRWKRGRWCVRGITLKGTRPHPCGTREPSCSDGQLARTQEGKRTCATASVEGD